MAFTLFGKRFISSGQPHIRLVLLLIILPVLVFAVHIFFYNSLYFNDNLQESAREYPYPRPRHAIQGFTYEGVVQGQKKMTITADSFTIEKKKLGFLRFGLLQEAVFLNAKVHLYGIDLSGGDKRGQSGGDKGGQFMGDAPFYGKFFSDKLLFMPEKVSSVRMTPVEFFLHDNENKVTGFSGQKGEISLKDKTILLSHQARAFCEDRQITAGRISLKLDKSLIEASRGVSYTSGAAPWTGEHLTTDFSLNRIQNEEFRTAKDK